MIDDGDLLEFLGGDGGLAAAISALARETGGDIVLVIEHGRIGLPESRCVIVKAGGRQVLRIEAVMSANAAPPHYIAGWRETTVR